MYHYRGDNNFWYYRCFLNLPLYFLLMVVDSLFSIKPRDYFCIKSHILEFLHYLLLCVCVPFPFAVYGTVIEFSQIKTYICITFGIPSTKARVGFLSYFLLPQLVSPLDQMDQVMWPVMKIVWRFSLQKLSEQMHTHIFWASY